MRRTLPILSALLLAALPVLAFGDAPAPAMPSYELKATLPIGEDGGWDYITVDPATDQLYVPRGNRVLVIDGNVDKPAPATTRILATLPDTPGVHGVALSPPELHRAYVSNGRDTSVSIFDTQTFKLIAKVPAGKKPDAIIYDPFTKKVFCMNNGGKTLTAFAADTADGKDAVNLELKGAPEFAVSDNAGHIYANTEDTSELLVIDAKAVTVSTRYPLAPNGGPTGLAIDLKTNRLFSTCSDSKTMAILDAGTGKILAAPAIGDGPDAAAFDPELQIAFASCRDGTLTLVHVDTPETFSAPVTVKTMTKARTCALNPKNHYVYLPTTDADKKFVILVYAPKAAK